MLKPVLSFGLAAALPFFFACSQDSTVTSAFLPNISALVAKAAPSGLGASSRSLAAFVQPDLADRATAANASEGLKDFFTDTFPSISGTSDTGFINAYLGDLDTRVAEVSGGTEPTCFSATPIETTFTVGAGSQTLTAKFSCVRKFGGAGDQSGTGSGLAFGQDDTYKYIYLILLQTNLTDKFGYVARIHKTTEEVDLLFLEKFGTYGRTKFFRLKTTPSTKRYELVIAGTGDSVGPLSTATTHVLSSGARLVTNETEIRADGTVATSTNSSGVATGSASFDSAECFSATNLATAPAACTSGAPTFSTDMTLVASSSLNGNTAIGTSLVTATDLITAGVTEVTSAR